MLVHNAKSTSHGAEMLLSKVVHGAFHVWIECNLNRLSSLEIYLVYVTSLKSVHVFYRHHMPHCQLMMFCLKTFPNKVGIWFSFKHWKWEKWCMSKLMKDMYILSPECHKFMQELGRSFCLRECLTLEKDTYNGFL